MFLEHKMSRRWPEMKNTVSGEKGTQNILDAISSKCKIIFPSTHVIYEGIDKVKNDIKKKKFQTNLSTTSKALNEKQLKQFKKL